MLLKIGILTFFLFIYHVIFYLNANSENDDGDEKIYNLSDILSTASSTSYAHQQRQIYFQEELHHSIPTLESIIPIGANKDMKNERYYIYSHTRKPYDTDEEEKRIISKSEKNRRERSSTLDRKQVSRNISLVLENLLMSYEKSQLPGKLI